MNSTTRPGPEDDSTSESEAESSAPIRVELDIELADETPCVNVDVDMRVTDISQHLKVENCECAEDCGECHMELTIGHEADTRREYMQTSIDVSCVCPVFERADCIPEIRVIDGQTMTVSLVMPDRSALSQIVDEIEEEGGTVHLKRVHQLSGEDNYTVKIDASEVTDKQREALEVAVEEGYYDRPREADLGVLAERLGVSKSAVSQRLNAVESNLVQTLIGGND